LKALDIPRPSGPNSTRAAIDHGRQSRAWRRRLSAYQKAREMMRKRWTSP
jgi:hypothetical protein